MLYKRPESRDLDDIYRNVPFDQIPWHSVSLPAAVTDLLSMGTIHPCRTVDLGCGTGTHAIRMAERGFNVTGIDISPRAVELAKANTLKSGVQCRFLTADLTETEPFSGDTVEFQSSENDAFDFAYEWEVLHHILPKNRKTYVENVHRMLKDGALYLSVSFHREDQNFGGRGKVRTTPLGTVLYFSTPAELERLFGSTFMILEQKLIDIPGRSMDHLSNFLLMEK